MGEPFTVTLTLVMSGLMYFSETRAPAGVGFDKEQKNALECPALRVQSDVEPAVRGFCKCHHLFSHDMIVCELLAAVVHAGCLFSQCIAADGPILQLNVYKLVDQL